MILYFIRHGKTASNFEHRYIGRTDEPLCQKGIEEIKSRSYPKAGKLVCSPMKRCIETAKIIYPDLNPFIVNDLRECDFGLFEGKNYEELCTDPYYQKWLDIMGTISFPSGESPNDFKNRCVHAFELTIRELSFVDSIAFVVHGGTIMSVMEKYAMPHREFYDYQLKNGEGYICSFDGKTITVIGDII